MDDELLEIRRTFVAEAGEGLAAMEESLLVLEARPDDADAVATVFRVAHTLKGNAASLGLDDLAHLAHALEDVLDALRRRTLRAGRAHVSLLLQAVDALRAMVPAAVDGTRREAPELLLRRLRRLGAAAQQRERASAGDTGGALQRERRAGGGRRADDVRELSEGRLRVAVGTLDRLLGLAGEITVARGRLGRLLAELGTAGEAAKDAHRDAERLFLELQELVLHARMVPLANAFRPHARTVRDVAAAHRKLARLVIEGEDVEVDTAVIEHIRDPLVHLVRNAVDHGLEPPARRRELGKDPMGTVTLRASRQGSTVLIGIADDGCGLDRERILQKGRERGLVGAHDRPPDVAIDALVFEPGFSTAETVTEISGRGVGMDVVRRDIEIVRGVVSIDTEPGRGTTVWLRVPLRVAIVDGFCLEVAGDTWVLPLDAVEECLPVTPADAPPGCTRGVLQLRGEPVPWVRLRELFGLGRGAARREEAVVVRHGDTRAALVADRLRGESAAVLRPLGPLLRDVTCGPSAGAVQGDGRVALVLDVGAVLRHASVTAAAAAP